VVDVTVADVLFVDVAIRAGKARDWFEMELPYLAGNGVGGTVASVGEGVDASAAATSPGRWSRRTR